MENNISVLNTAENDCKMKTLLRILKMPQSLFGITLETVGNLPTDNNAVARVLTFATMQCLNNAARHAKADKMILEVLTTVKNIFLNLQITAENRLKKSMRAADFLP